MFCDAWREKITIVDLTNFKIMQQYFKCLLLSQYNITPKVSGLGHYFFFLIQWIMILIFHNSWKTCSDTDFEGNCDFKKM